MPCISLMACLAAFAAAEPSNTIAVLDFQPSNAPLSEAVAISGFVRSAMFRSRTFIVVDKKNMDKILAEQAFQQTGCTASDCAVKLGKVLNVRKMVVGEYTLMGGVRFLTASLVDVESGQIEAMAKVKGFEIAEADDAADKLVVQLIVDPNGPASPSLAPASSSRHMKQSVTRVPEGASSRRRSRHVSVGLVSPLPGLQYEQAIGDYLSISGRIGAGPDLHILFFENLAFRIRPAGRILRGFFIGPTACAVHTSEFSSAYYGLGGGAEIGYTWIAQGGLAFQIGAGGWYATANETYEETYPSQAPSGQVIQLRRTVSKIEHLAIPLVIISIGYSW